MNLNNIYVCKESIKIKSNLPLAPRQAMPRCRTSQICKVTEQTLCVFDKSWILTSVSAVVHREELRGERKHMINTLSFHVCFHSITLTLSGVFHISIWSPAVFAFLSLLRYKSLIHPPFLIMSTSPHFCSHPILTFPPYVGLGHLLPSDFSCFKSTHNNKVNMRWSQPDVCALRTERCE